MGALLVIGVEPKHVLSLRDTRADTPADANNLLRALSAMFGWGSLRGWRSNNPCLRVPKLKGGDGWAPWPWDMIQHLREHAALHLWEAAALALYTGQRMSDVLAMLWSDIDQGLIAVVQNKTKKKLWVPIHKELAALLRVLEGRLRKMLGQGGNDIDFHHYHKPILLNTRGQPWTGDGFKASWAKQLNKREMSEIRRRRFVFHGLRKSAVVFLLEAGCSDAETASITGQSRRIVEHYAK
jgi:integrase